MTNNESVLDRPNIAKLIHSFNQLFAVEKDYKDAATFHGEYHDKIMSDERWIEAENYIKYNSKYLRSIGPNKINKQNLSKLIDTISADGQFHFNMSAFFGIVDESQKEWGFEMGKTDVSSLSPSLLNHCQEPLFNHFTKSFNCDSVGCIAGFASAIALGWNDEAVRNFNKTTNPIRVWEHISCNFLNIPIEIGEKIFYGEKGSVWSFLKVHDSNFNSLEYDDDTTYGIDEEYIDENDWEEIAIDLHSIEYKKATEMLSMILEEEIVFNANFNPTFTKKYWQKQS